MLEQLDVWKFEWHCFPTRCGENLMMTLSSCMCTAFGGCFYQTRTKSVLGRGVCVLEEQSVCLMYTVLPEDQG